jgi:hypothetical protein
VSATNGGLECGLNLVLRLDGGWQSRLRD